MALLSFEEEQDRATKQAAFSNGFEGEVWQSLWCDECVLFEDCPLILVAWLGRTPAPWIERDRASINNRYTCDEFEEKLP